MKKQLVLVGALLLSCGTPFWSNTAQAASEPQQEQTTATTIGMTGKIVDEKGEPIIGASVMEKGTTRGTATDADGNFNLKVKAGSTITVSYIGYKTKEVKAAKTLNLALNPDQELLDEVVVVGYGVQKKVNLTGAVTAVDLDKTMAGRPQQDVAKALQGAVPGLTITTSSGALDNTAQMRIRGVGTLSNGEQSNPLIVVDGVPMDDISSLNTQDIESISVLKDAASSSIYGTRAAFGVILIQTKGAKTQDRVTVSYQNNFAWDQATYLPDFPDVPTQLTSALEARANQGVYEVELFGMYFDKMLPEAIKWRDQHNGKKIGYQQMMPYVGGDNIGDFKMVGNTPYYYADFDVQDIYFDKAAPSQSHNVAIDGTTGKTNYHLSFGYNYRQDLMKLNPARARKYNVAANITTNITDWLQVGTRMSFARQNHSRPDTWANTYQYLWRWGSFFIPSGYAEGPDGKMYDFRVMSMLKQASQRRTTTDVTRMTGFLKADIIKGLTLNADFTYAIENMDSGSEDFSVYGINWASHSPKYIVAPKSTAIWRDGSKRNTWTLNIYANYMKSFKDAHNINVMLGANAEESEYHYLYGKRKGLYDQVAYPELNMAAEDGQQLSWAHSDRASAGYFGRINYDYKGIYLLELNGRYDGSSRFPHTDHWAFFPSASVGYRISEEAFFNPIKHVVNNAKIRASYGEIGNEAIGDYKFEELIGLRASKYVNWVTDNGINANKIVQSMMPDLVSKSLSWERIRTLNVGLDLGLLNNEVTLGFDWFQRENRDMLAPSQVLPSTLGASAPYTNAGKLRTRGWEFNVNWHRQFGEVGLYASFNLSDSKTKVTEWENETKGINAYYTGRTYGDIWGFETDRYFTEDDFVGQNADGSWTPKEGIASQKALETGAFHYGPGDVKFVDRNGDGKIDGGKGTESDHGDLKVIGNSLPRYEYSFHIGGNWKGFDLDLFFQGVGKRDSWNTSSFAFPMMVNADIAIYDHQLSYNKVNYSADYKTVTGYEINQNNDFPRLYPGCNGGGSVPNIASGCYNYYPQDRYLTDMSYLRLKNMTVGYTLPQELTRKAAIEKARIYFSGSNLFLLHKGNDLPIDPEIDEAHGPGGFGRTAPITRTFSFGLQVTL